MLYSASGMSKNRYFFFQKIQIQCCLFLILLFGFNIRFLVSNTNLCTQ